MADVNLGQLASTTLKNYQKTLVDNIFKKHVLLDHLKNNGGTKMFDGGRNLVAPLMYGTNDTVMAFSGTDVLDNTYQEGIDAAEWDWKYYNVSIVITATDESKNRGKSAIINLLRAKIKQAESSLSETINQDLLTGSSAKTLVGLDSIIGTTNTVGSISGSSYSWWQSNVDSTAEVLTFADMRSVKNNCRNGAGGSRPSLILASQNMYEKMFALTTAMYGFNPGPRSKEGKRLADASFEVLEFEGVPVSYDEAIADGTIYFLNSENYKLGILDGWNMQTVNKPAPSNQHVTIKDIVFGGAAYTDRRKSLGKMTGKTAS